MAGERKPPTTGVLDEPAPIALQEGKITAQVATYVSQLLLTVVKKLNGLLTLGDGTTYSWSGNIDGQWIDVVYPSTPNTELVVRHGLKRVPTEVFHGTPTAACSFYSDRSSWTRNEVRLKCDTASVTVRLWLV